MRTTRKRGGKQSTAPSEGRTERVMLARLGQVFAESIKRFDAEEQHGPVRILVRDGRRECLKKT